MNSNKLKFEFKKKGYVIIRNFLKKKINSIKKKLKYLVNIKLQI